MALQAKGLYQDIEGSRYLYPADQQPWLSRKLRELNQAGRTPDQSTNDQVDKLEKRVQKLEAKLQQLTSQE